MKTFTPEQKKEFINHVLRRISYRAAKDYRTRFVVEAQPRVRDRYREQKDIHYHSAPRRRAEKVVEKRYPEGYRRNRGKAADKFYNKAFGARPPEQNEGVKHIQFGQKLQNDAHICPNYALYHLRSPRPAYQSASSAKNVARRGRLICSVLLPTCNSKPFTPTMNLGFTK